MQKEKIRKCIETYQTGIVETLEKEYKSKTEFSNKEENNIDDADAHSHELEAHSDSELINDRLESARASLEYFKSIPQIETDKVSLGSLIETDSFLIYVGISTQKFSDDGREIIGISIKAPIYQSLENKTVGDSFKFGGTDCRILSIQ